MKWIEDRREHLIATNHAREAECELEIACERDGTILALRGRAHTDVGAYLRTNGVTPSRNIAQVSSGPYRIPHVHIDVSLMLTNKTPVGTYRGPGRFEADFFRERLFDMAAADLGIDRVEFRRRNLVAETRHAVRACRRCSRSAAKTATDSGDYRGRRSSAASQEFDWAGKAQLNGKLDRRALSRPRASAAISKAARRGRRRARGWCSKPTAPSRSTSARRPSGRDSRPCSRRSPPMRSRCRWRASAACSTAPPSGVQEGFGSYSSRSTVMGGSAIVDTPAKLLLIAIREAAAARFGCAPDEVEIVDGRKCAGRGGKSVTLAELAAGARSPPRAAFASNKRTYSYGAHAAHVAVDPRTGHVELLDYVAVEDVGPHHQSAHAARPDASARSCRAWAACCSSTSSTTTRRSS